MRVTRLIGALLLAVALAMSFVLGPVTAGEHPWSEDPFDNGGDTNGGSLSSSALDADGNPVPGVDDLAFGTDMLWLTLIGSDLGSEDPSGTTTDPGGSVTQQE